MNSGPSLSSGGPSSSSGGGTASHGKEEQLKKEFDGSIKGNVFLLEGQKIVIPGGGDKGSKLEIVHRYLVLQVYLASGDPFSLEL